MAVQYLCCTLLHTHSIATIGPFIAFHFGLHIIYALEVLLQQQNRNQLHAQSLRYHTNKSRYKNTVSYSCKGNGSVNWLKTSLCKSIPARSVAPAHGAHRRQSSGIFGAERRLWSPTVVTGGWAFTAASFCRAPAQTWSQGAVDTVLRCSENRFVEIMSFVQLSSLASDTMLN